MKKSLLALILVMVSASLLIGQNEDINPCGTAPVKSEWLKKYQANPQNYRVDKSVVVNVPITIHRVGRNNTKGKLSESAMLKAMCTLEQDFAGSDLEFYLNGSIREIDDSGFFVHNEVLDGAYKMFEYNVENSINCYFVGDAAGNCGYNLPYAGVCVQEACAGQFDHTWAHEMGHALSLPHPFLGWEGGVSHDGSVGHDFNDPAPDTILYNYTYYQDTLILDTLIIDTAIVEKVDGSNCQFAADGFCDTKPDYLASRWGCQTDSTSFVEQTDPDGAKFYSDGSLIMSYALDNCSDRFTSEQMAAMRANAMTEKGAYTSTDLNFSAPDDPTDIELLRPTRQDLVYFRDVEFSWTQDNNDQFYLFQIGVEPTFSVILYDTIVESSSIIIPSVDDSWGTLHWRVKPFTANDWCGGFSEGSFFETTDVTNVEDVPENDITVYPNILDGSQRHIIISGIDAFNDKRYMLYDASGNQVQSGALTSASISINDLFASGMYYLRIIDGQKSHLARLVVIR